MFGLLLVILLQISGINGFFGFFKKHITYEIIFNNPANTTLTTIIEFKKLFSVPGIDVMTAAADTSVLPGREFDFEATYFGQFTGFFIDSINNGTAFIPTACDTFPVDCFFWQLRVNDVVSDVGISLVELYDGDKLTWEYIEFE
mmetsp:Transcript_82759/g.101464  ORF Transcript_82759/g.101464 Transcript_82759/m.101464 type:complete len:144 (-) Transcript_82759:251-682(-)